MGHDGNKAGAEMITFTIPDTPPSWNEIAGYGHAVGEKNKWADMLVIYALQAGWQKLRKCKFANCTVILRFPSKRRIDEDNYRKVFKDALFYADLIWDDCVQKLNFHLTAIPDTGKRETEIKLW